MSSACPTSVSAKRSMTGCAVLQRRSPDRAAMPSRARSEFRNAPLVLGAGGISGSMFLNHLGLYGPEIARLTRSFESRAAGDSEHAGVVTIWPETTTLL